MAEKNVRESTLYKGRVKTRFFPDSHIYMIDGKRKTGVTTYIGIMDKSRALMSWKGQRVADFLLKKLKEGKITEDLICAASYIDEIEKEEAGVVGTAIHAWCESYIKSKLGMNEAPEMPERKEVQVGVNAFLDWEKKHKVKFLSSERLLYSKKHDYSGIMDIEAKVDGELCLVDLKSSNGLYNSVRMQTAAYVMADVEESGRKYIGRWAVRLPKYDEKEYYEREEKKKEIKGLIAKYKGVEFKDYEIPIYQIFEAKYLDEKAGDIEYDFAAFLHAKSLFIWNKDTDFWANK